MKERGPEVNSDRKDNVSKVLDILESLKKGSPKSSWLSAPYSGLELSYEVNWSERKKKAKELIRTTLNDDQRADKIDQVIDGLVYHSGIFKSQDPNFEEAELKIKDIINNPQ